MKKTLTLASFAMVLTLLALPIYARYTADTSQTPYGYHIHFFEDTLFERHRDLFEGTFLTDEAHMDWLIQSYQSHFPNDWYAWDALRWAMEHNAHHLPPLSLEALTSLTILELRDQMMTVLYAIDVAELGLDDFVGGLRWSVYNVNPELTTETLIERLIYVMGIDNLTPLFPN